MIDNFFEIKLVIVKFKENNTIMRRKDRYKHLVYNLLELIIHKVF